MRAVFQIDVKLYIARLLDKVHPAVLTSSITSWPEAADRPSPYAVRTAGKITFLEGQYFRIGIGIGYAGADMEDDRIPVVDLHILRIVEIALEVLGERDVRHHVSFISFRSRVECFGKGIE